jgi:hypothetical protein
MTVSMLTIASVMERLMTTPSPSVLARCAQSDTAPTRPFRLLGNERMNHQGAQNASSVPASSGGPVRAGRRLIRRSPPSGRGSSYLPPHVRIHRQHVDDVGPALTVQIAVAIRREEIASRSAWVADRNPAEVVAGLGLEGREEGSVVNVGHVASLSGDSGGWASNSILLDAPAEARRVQDGPSI